MNMTENFSANPNQSQRISMTINGWKSKLLDLSKRNRALNFKIQKVSTVTIVDEQPAEIFKLLCLQGKSLKFLPQTKQEKTAETESDVETNVSDVEELEDNLPVQDFAPYEGKVLADHHTDDYLQTNASPEQLDKSLRRLEAQSHLIIEEQGVNALFLSLGTLHYRESADSQEFYKAPLIFVPVELSRKSARAGFTIKATEDETIVNPSLVEYLNRSFGITLPDIPDSSQLNENYDVQQFFAGVSEVVSIQKEWKVKNEIYLALFSFQKLVMYKDLEKNAASLAAHKIISNIITRNGHQFMGLPEEISRMELDQEFAPEATAQVVDADSSQLRAISAVARNYDLVLEGPPGTGKSQTITNLIAQTLSAGKTVLFVAEKMAALDVVHRRLVAAGLGEFCLELHSTKANKRAVMQQIRTALDASLQRLAGTKSSTDRLPVVRARLSEYARSVHAPFGSLNLSPYRIYGELGKVLDAPKLALQVDIFNTTQAQLNDILRDLKDLAVAAEVIGSPSKHAWRDTTKTFYSEQGLDQISALGSEIIIRLENIIERATAVESALGLPPIRNFIDIETAVEIAKVLSCSPGAPLAVLSNPAWNIAPPEARGLLEKGRKINAEKTRLLKRFLPETLVQNHADDIAYIERKSEGFLSFLAFLDSRYRAIKKRWIALRQSGYDPTLLEQATDFKAIGELQREQRELEMQYVLGSQLFGPLWQGELSNWQALENYIAWVLDFRRLCVQHGLKEQAINIASLPAPDMSNVQPLAQGAKEIQINIEQLCSLVGFKKDYFANSTLSEMLNRISELLDHLRLAPRWAAFETSRQKVECGIAAELLPFAMSEQLAFNDLAAAFGRSFYQKWLTLVVQERPPLLNFQTLTHEQRIKEFQELDERVLRENRAELIGLMRERLQYNLQKPEMHKAMSFLRRELVRQRGLAPLRMTMKQAFPAIRVIKSCFMMSPQTVAQLLENTEEKFDVVIFDEASQLPTEEAVGAIIRGQQLVVVGDPKQLPPTNFFAIQSGTVNVQYDEDGLPLYEDSQSILEEVAAAGVPNSRLKWHYRSAYESLIAFSNINFYDAELYTFPSVETDNDETGLHFEFVADGVYEGKGLNLIEARRVADAVVRHAKTKPNVSLGVGTFNMRQQLAIQDELEQRRRRDSSIEPFFDRSKEEPFFVKNLENIQGDERDIIFISVTYAKASDGKLRYNFGPLNNENGWRRLNVLITRARKLMRVFSSIRGEDINPAGTTSRGAQLLHDFLIYAEHKRLDSPVLSALAETESPFERDVFQELTNRGVRLIPQVGVSGYRLDFGVLDDEVAGRFICGIECDGVAYHSSETARDRDRLRQQVLEARGWEIHRLWSTDWFKDRGGQIERLLEVIEQSRRRAKVEQANDREQKELEEHEREKEIRESLDEPGENAIVSLIGSHMIENYVRPKVPPYRYAAFQKPLQGLLEMPVNQLAYIIVQIANMESPIHFEDLAKRTANVWEQKAGSRITAHIEKIVRLLHQGNHLELRDAFIWKKDGELRVRSRVGTNIPAERIAPEEVQEAILMTLRAAQAGFTRQNLTNEVRSLFGFNRTGAALKQVIDDGIEALLTRSIIGEGSVGIMLRK
jgi:superfamily I DNA and/or RNA helicase/very-short-patch-repair endonuclease